MGDISFQDYWFTNIHVWYTFNISLRVMPLSVPMFALLLFVVQQGLSRSLFAGHSSGTYLSINSIWVC